MSHAKSVAFAACSHCSAIQSTSGSWRLQDDSVAKTTKKLDTCGRCYIARYCNQACQRGDWKAHKPKCKPSKRMISSQELHAVVKSVDPQMTGSICITFDRQIASLNPPIEEPETSDLDITVQLHDDTEVGPYFYQVCYQIPDWQAKLDAILHPKDGFYNYMLLIDLGQEMIKNGLHAQAFQMVAEHTPEHYDFLKNMFFSSAVPLMQQKGIPLETIVSCAEHVKKNRAEVEVLIQPTLTRTLPNDLQILIENAQSLPYGARDVQMVDLAKQVVSLGAYDQAFDLVYNWIAVKSAKINFFQMAAKKMIDEGVKYDKIEQLGKSIGLNEKEILNEAVGIYTICNQEFACKLAKRSDDPDYFLTVIFSALCNKGKKKEAKEILPLIPPRKRRDLEFYLRQTA